MKPEIKEAIDLYVEALNQKDRVRSEATIADFVRRQGYDPRDKGIENFMAPYTYHMDKPGKRFVRIYADQRGQTMCHAFVDVETGEVHKSAGWKAPFKSRTGGHQPRYDLMNPESRALLFRVCDFSGGYLYADFKEREAV